MRAIKKALLMKELQWNFAAGCRSTATLPPRWLDRLRYWIAANARSAAESVCSMSSSECAAETNPAS